MLKRFCKNGCSTATANIVDGNLILTLPDALNPVIWKMELGSVKSSAIEVRANDNVHLLCLKTPKGDVHDIAPFEHRAQAVDALMKISRALSKADGKIQTGAQAGTAAASAPAYHAPATSGGGGRKVAFVIAAILILLLLLSFIPSFIPETSGDAGAGLPPQSTGSESGVPLSADQYLRGF